jgi:hypothetical protein
VANSQAALDAIKGTNGQAQRTNDMQKKLFDEKVISQVNSMLQTPITKRLRLITMLPNRVSAAARQMCKVP